MPEQTTTPTPAAAPTEAEKAFEAAVDQRVNARLAEIAAKPPPPLTPQQAFDAAAQAVKDFDVATNQIMIGRQQQRTVLVKAQHDAGAALTK